MPRLNHSIQLVVANGPDAGHSVLLERPTLTVGTGVAAHLRLTDDTVAQEHIQLSIHPEGVRLRDLGSSGGTWVGTVCVQEAIFTQSTSIVIGSTTLSVLIRRHSSISPPSTIKRFGEGVAESASMCQIFETLERAAKEEVSILIHGESGVGKDVLANAVHRSSSRASGPFVTVDCSAISPALIESHLFGHERGAFTGADREHEGAFAQADGGTLFLDEIGELPIELQPKLLRALENREVRRVGGSSTRRVDVRVIAATNRNLLESAAKNEFRRDLYYRLAVLSVEVPPLRARREDIPVLARRFYQQAAGDHEATLAPDVEARLLAHSWPGNVRELKNVIQRLVVLGANAPDLFGDEVQASLPPSASDLAHLPYREARAVAIARFERAYLPTVLARTGNVVVRAAKHAGVERGSFHRMLGRIRETSHGN
jgi:DNA-binding NtrC family response regulator